MLGSGDRASTPRVFDIKLEFFFKIGLFLLNECRLMVLQLDFLPFPFGRPESGR